jgi:integrase
MSSYTGLRAGELAALRIRDINLLHGVVEVRRTVHRRTGHGWVYTSPKSARGVREVPLTPALLVEMRSWLAAHPAATDPDASLWPGTRNTGKGGVPDWNAVFDINNIGKRYFRPMMRSGALLSAGISTATRWHDLRHTYASIMAAAGVDVRLVSQWMGHSSISVTEKTYTHLFRQDYTDVMARVGAFVAGPGQALSRDASVTALRQPVGEPGRVAQ